MSEEEKRQQDKRRREEELLAALLLLLLGQFNHYTEDLTDIDQWQLHVLGSLVPAHQQAAVLGRQRAGATQPQGYDDLAFAQGVVNTQVPFLEKFAAALKSGDPRYVDEEGNLLVDAINARLAKYAERVVGTANEAFVLASPPNSKWIWNLMMGANHCDDCPPLAAGSPYTAYTLPSVPGDGATQCNVLCACELIRSDGVAGFSRAMLGVLWH